MPKSKYPLVTIIILNWNGKKLLKTCLSSLFKLTDYPNYKVIVVDNGSTDGSVEFVKKNFPKADVLALDKNYGYAKGNNEGIKYALKKYNPDYVLLLNNDTKIIQKNWLTEMVKVAESNEKIGIVGCKLLYPNGKIQHAGVDLESLCHRGGGYPSSAFNNIERMDIVTGACFLISKNLIEKIGFLDENYSPFLYEDVDYCLRARRGGFEIYYVGTVKLIHFESFSIKKQRDLKRFYATRKNSLIFIIRYYGFTKKLKEITKSFSSIFFSKKYAHKPPRANNLVFHPNFPLRAVIFFKAFFEALIKAPRFSIR